MRRVLLLVGTMVLATLLGSPATPVGTAAAAGRAELVDFNGDNLVDLAVGAPGENLGVRADAGAGAVSTMHGSAGGLAGTVSPLFQGNDGLGTSPSAATGSGRHWPRASSPTTSTTTPSTTWPSASPWTTSATGRTPAWSASSRARRLAFRARARSTSRVPTSAGGARVGGVAEAGDLLGAAVE
jgi:FG-GAP repeat